MQTKAQIEIAKLKQKKEEMNNRMVLEAVKAGREILNPSIDGNSGGM